jgi:hypothetical protein
MNIKKIVKAEMPNRPLESCKANGHEVFVGMQVSLHKKPGRRAGKYQVGQIELDRTEQVLISVYQGNGTWHYIRPEAIKTVHVKTRAEKKT